MKVLLIQPSFTIFKTEARICHPPLGLAYLAAALKEDHDCFIMDTVAEGYDQKEFAGGQFVRYGLPFKDIKRRIEHLMPDVVGVSCLFSAQSQNAHKICAAAKQIDKGIVTVLGGAHPSAVPQEVLEDSNVDFVIIGEGEDTLSRLLECIEGKGGVQRQDIDGLGFKYNGYIRINQRKSYQKNLDDLPFPRWDIFPLEKYFRINNPHGGSARNLPFLPMVTSRGCPFECIFCSVRNLWGKNYRKRSTENVLTELDYLVNKFGIKEVLFEDDNLTLDKGRAKEIFRRMIEERFNLSWSVPNGIAVQTLDDEMLELMKASGCYRISIGVESGDEGVLKNIIKKPITLSAIKPAIHKAKRLGLETVAFFVVGFPGESRTQLKNTFRFAEGLDVDNANFFFATPLPGTRLLQVCKERGLIEEGLDYTRLKSDYPVFATETYSINELESVVSRERIKLHFLYMLKNPGKFIYKLWRKFLNDPGYFLRFTLRHTR